MINIKQMALSYMCIASKNRMSIVERILKKSYKAKYNFFLSYIYNL